MENEKKTASKKARLIYSGELLFFAIIFAVIATLEITRVLTIRDWVLIVFNWLTIFGGTWMIVDFFWVLFSKKRRKKNSLIDKILLVPLGIYLITYDILCFANIIVDYDPKMYMMTSAFYYLTAIYIFQAIFHFFIPVPALLEDEEEEKKETEVIVEDNEANKKEENQDEDHN